MDTWLILGIVIAILILLWGINRFFEKRRTDRAVEWLKINKTAEEELQKDNPFQLVEEKQADGTFRWV